MAPSEFDLRAALRDGEGDAPNADRLIMAGQRRRAQRRARLLSTTVVVAVVGGVAFGATQLGGNSSSGGGGSQYAGGAVGGSMGEPAHGGNSSAAEGGGVAAAPSAARALSGVSCPSAVPQYAAAPKGVAHRATNLFNRPVASIVVCAYGFTFDAASSPPRNPARLELAGNQATRFAISLETAPTTAPARPCANVSTEQYAVIPVDSAGNPFRPVTARLPGSACGSIVTNGTAVRYAWQPPPGVAARLERLTPTEPPDSPAASPTR